MNWEAVGAIAESLGAVGVIATLIYLSVQIRQTKDATESNTRSLHMQSGRQISFQFSDWHREVARDPELVKIMMKSVQVPMAEYSKEEWNQFNMFAKSWFHIAEAQYISKEMGLGFEDQDEGYLRAGRTLISTWPAWKKFWDEESRTNFWPPGFVEELAKSDIGSMEGIKSIGSEPDSVA